MTCLPSLHHYSEVIFLGRLDQLLRLVIWGSTEAANALLFVFKEWFCSCDSIRTLRMRPKGTGEASRFRKVGP